jgi:glycosyltransferase involved in cell wall biosynthesis
MKIGINAMFLGEKPTGVGVCTREISRALFQLHKEIIFFSPVSHTDMPYVSAHKVSDVMRGSPRLLNNLLRMVYTNTALPIRCKLSGIDVLYCPITEFPFVPLVPLVVHVHDLHPVYFPSQFGLAASRLKFSLKIMDRVAKRVLVSSEFVKRELMDMTNMSAESIDVIPLSYRRDLFKPMPPEMRKDFLNRYSLSGNYILFVGTLFPYKNLKTLLNAFSSIRSRIPHSLVIIGRREFAEGLPAGNHRIIYLDYVRTEDLPFFYSYADVFVYPSLREGFGIAPLEAMACGTPVISSSGGSLPEVIANAGVLFDPEDSEMLASLILQVLRDKKIRAELVDRGFRHVKKFSWDRTAEEIISACNKALKEE